MTMWQNDLPSVNFQMQCVFRYTHGLQTIFCSDMIFFPNFCSFSHLKYSITNFLIHNLCIKSNWFTIRFAFSFDQFVCLPKHQDNLCIKEHYLVSSYLYPVDYHANRKITSAKTTYLKFQSSYIICCDWIWGVCLHELCFISRQGKSLKLPFVMLLKQWTMILIYSLFQLLSTNLIL